MGLEVTHSKAALVIKANARNYSFRQQTRLVVDLDTRHLPVPKRKSEEKKLCGFKLNKTLFSLSITTTKMAPTAQELLQQLEDEATREAQAREARKTKLLAQIAEEARLKKEDEMREKKRKAALAKKAKLEKDRLERLAKEEAARKAAEEKVASAAKTTTTATTMTTAERKAQQEARIGKKVSDSFLTKREVLKRVFSLPVR